MCDVSKGKEYSSILRWIQINARATSDGKDKHAFSCREVAKIGTSILIQTRREFSESAYYARTMQPLNAVMIELFIRGVIFHARFRVLLFSPLLPASPVSSCSYARTFPPPLAVYLPSPRTLHFIYLFLSTYCRFFAIFHTFPRRVFHVTPRVPALFSRHGAR